MGDYDDKQFGVNSADGAEGDKGEAMKRTVRMDGAPEQDMEFEGEHPNGNVSARQMNNSGRE